MCKICDYITASIVDKSKKHDRILPKRGISKFHERMGIFLTIKPKEKKRCGCYKLLIHWSNIFFFQIRKQYRVPIYERCNRNS